jgi:hypothetical protein
MSLPHEDAGAAAIESQAMTREIVPLSPEDLDRLSRFLTAGFHTAPGAVFAAEDVLEWKYLTGRNADEPPRSYVARDEGGTIIGHVGICPTAFEGAAISGGSVATLHMIDWLGSAEHRSVGASLMRRAHEGVPTQFGLGGSEAGRTVIKRGGYEPREPIPVYQRILRPSHWLGVPSLNPVQRAARLTRDLVRNLARPARPARTHVELRQVAAFGPEIDRIVEEARTHAILTSRTSSRLNHLLGFPRKGMSGWLIHDDGGPRGFALLNIVPKEQGGSRMGKIVDCLLDGVDVDLWHAALLALTQELSRQGADLAQSFAGTPWMAEGLNRSGYRSRFALEFSVRDRMGLVPRGIPVHLTPIEADYAYT